MEAKIGNYVQTEGHSLVGRVYAKYHNFSETSEDDEWFNGLSIKPDISKKTQPWYSILVEGGGAILTWEDDIIKVEKERKTPLKNIWESWHFDDVEE
jgi:heat shock protein HspQ